MQRTYYDKVIYHVFSRGNNRKKVLKTDKLKIEFIKVLAKYKRRFNYKLYGFVLMDNHFHLIIENDCLFNISRIMQAILLSYSCRFRNNNEYYGHVWQGRFKSRIIVDENYLNECLGYLHNNPVKANIVDKAEDYCWSSALFYSDKENKKINKIISIDKYGSTSAVNN